MFVLVQGFLQVNKLIFHTLIINNTESHMGNVTNLT